MLKIVPAAALAAALMLLASAPAGSAVACARNSYAYGGVMSSQAGHGVSALIVPLGVPAVWAGHVAAWVGVGGEGLGPNGSTTWLQAGLSADTDGSLSLYFELALPGRAARYVMLKGHVPYDLNYRVGILATRDRPGWWTVFVNGRPATRAIELPGSRTGWRPMATTESWSGTRTACNRFAFRFADVSVADRPGGSWTPLDKANVLQTHGARVRFDASGFVANGGP